MKTIKISQAQVALLRRLDAQAAFAKKYPYTNSAGLLVGKGRMAHKASAIALVNRGLVEIRKCVGCLDEAHLTASGAKAAARIAKGLCACGCNEAMHWLCGVPTDCRGCGACAGLDYVGV